jgi:hypothetical protein
MRAGTIEDRRQARSKLLSRAFFLGTLAIVAGVFATLDAPLRVGHLDTDEAFFVWAGWSITKGLAPYRDFLDYKPPLVFLTHALALVIHGFSGFRYRWFFVWFPLGSLIALLIALRSRRMSPLVMLALAVAIMGIWVNARFHESGLSDSESIGLSFYFLGVACLIARTRFAGALRIAGGGLLVCCVLSKEPFLPSVVSTWLSCLLLETEVPGPPRAALRYIRQTSLGAISVLAASAIYLVPTGGASAYLAMVARYARLYNDPTRSYCALLGRFRHTTVLGDVVFQVRMAHDHFLNLRVLAPVVPFLLAFGWAAVTRRFSRALTLAAIGTLVASYAALTATHCQWKHDYVMTMSGVFFVSILGADALGRLPAETRSRRIVAYALVAIAALAVGPRVVRAARAAGSLSLPDPFEEPVPGVRAAVASQTTAADRIVTTGFPGLYVQVDRRSAMREAFLLDEALGFYDGDSDEERVAGLRAELEANRPKLVILDPVWAARQERYRRALFQPFLTAHAYREIAPGIWSEPQR